MWGGASYDQNDMWGESYVEIDVLRDRIGVFLKIEDMIIQS